jgi:hypothetical protein
MSLLASVGTVFSQTNLYPPQLAAFRDAKEAQEQQLARELHVRVPAEVNDFFKLAHREDFVAFSNMVYRLWPQLYPGSSGFTNGQPVWMPFWQPVTEVETAYEIFTLGGRKYPMAFGEGIIQSIPAGSIYFGGTDGGRMLVTALCASHAEGKPFYTLTQNALADNRYVDYLRGMYGKAITLPTTNDMNQISEEYKADALLRLRHDQQFPTEPRQLARGEDVREVNGELKMDGPVAVMAMSAREVKWILDHNPKPEFYYEESYQQELLYPYLSPHGLIFKLNHERLSTMPVAEMDADRAFWSQQCGAMLGDWLKPGSSVSNVCAFVKAVYREKDLSHFSGDPEFLTNDFAPQAFSKLRVSIAGLYQWRLMKAAGTDDAKRLRLEADYAFRQAYALCPTSPEVLFRYVDFLTAQRRFDDAILIVRTTLRLAPADDHFYDQYENLMMQLKQYREQAGALGN